MNEDTRQHCIACGGTQIPVQINPQSAGNTWTVQKVGRGIRDMLAERYKTGALTFACIKCGRITFYAENLQDLLGG